MLLFPGDFRNRTLAQQCQGPLYDKESVASVYEGDKIESYDGGRLKWNHMSFKNVEKRDEMWGRDAG